MKKLYKILSLSLCLLAGMPNVKAETHLITVQDFMFIPSNLSVVVGDTVVWAWLSGSHTTTSTTVPSGAATWNATLNSGNPGFMYEVTEPGTYTYRCVPHAGMGMTGTFNATPTGIEQISAPVLNLNSNFVNSELEFNYSLMSSSHVKITLYDLTGKDVRTLVNENLQAGLHSRNEYVGDLPKGIYILNLVASGNAASRKITIH